MKKEHKFIKFAAKAAFPTLIVLIIVSLASIFLVYSDASVRATGFPGLFATLFNYGYFEKSSGQFIAQVFGNAFAYCIALTGVALFIVSFVAIKHDKKTEIKAALLSLTLFVPAVLGLVGGVFNFLGQGIGFLLAKAGIAGAAITFLLFLLYILDIVYYVFVIAYVSYSVVTGFKIAKGEMSADDLEEEVAGPAEVVVHEDKAAKAEERVQLLVDIRRIVREELERLDKVAIVREEVVEKVVEKVEEPIAEEPAPVEEAPVEEPIAEEPAPVEEAPVEEPVAEEPAPVEEAPVEEAPAEEPVAEEPAPVEEAPVEAEGETDRKIIDAVRIPFAEKMARADEDICDKYNELKQEILAYGCNSRISIGGDTFRLHRKPYVKITLVGKTLKVYFALNPSDFVDSPMPVVDAGDKSAYAEVPSLLRVRSNLSLKRAKELVALAFNRDGIEKSSDVVEHDYVEDLRKDLK